MTANEKAIVTTATESGATATQRIVETFRKNRLVPVIVIDDAKQAVPLARALEEGGLPCAEITFRTPRALEALENISAECPSVLVGAGTVLTPRQAADAR